MMGFFARLFTRPAATGSLTAQKTVGILESLAAEYALMAAGVATPMMRSYWEETMFLAIMSPVSG